VARAKQHLFKWINSAMKSKLEPFKNFVAMVRSHWMVFAWTKIRLPTEPLRGVNNKINRSVTAFGFRSAGNFIAAIYHCCARLPLPVER
jgi:transposase